jgi:hypothetical protein
LIKNAIASRSLLILLLLVAPFVMLGCLPTSMKLTGSGSSSSTTAPSSAAPSPDSGTSPTVAKVSIEQAGPMANRKYIAQVLEEVFDTTTASYPNNVNATVTTALIKPGVYGLGCDLYSSSSNLDCNGDTASATIAPILISSSTVRQVSTLNLCENIINAPNSVKAAAEKAGEITASNANEITATNLPKIFSLFYRTRDMTPDELNAYLAFNSALLSAGVSRTDRWKSILVSLCETPEWQTY